MKAINLYLDKKLVSKLLTIFLCIEDMYRIQYLMDEILSYFGLDFIALNITNNDKVISFKSTSISRFFPENEVKTLLNYSLDIEGEVGNKHIKIEDHRQFLVFKHEHLSMIAVLEAKHHLSYEEKETLGNEIMIIIKLAIFATVKKTSQDLL